MMEVLDESNPKSLGLCQQKTTEKFYFISDFIRPFGRNFSLFDSDEVQRNSRKQWIGYTKLDRIYKVFYTKENRRTDMSRKIRRHFTDDFKQQIVDLHNAGMKRSELIKEYELTPSTFDKWVRQAKLTGSFKSVDNMTDEQRELIQLKKRNKELEMQLDILKQAAVIMARKDK